MPKVNISSLNIKITGSSRGLSLATQQGSRSLSKFARDARRDSQGLSNSFREFERILARTILLYGTFRAAGAVKDQLFDSVRLAVDAEKADIAFEVLLGDVAKAKKLVADLYTFADRTSFQLDEVRESAQALAAYGFEAEKIIPFLQRIGDIASGNTSVGLKEMADLFGRTRVENRLYTRDLNQFTSRGILVADELAKILGKNVTEIRKMAEEGTLFFSDVEMALQSLTNEGGKFFGLTARLAATTGGEYEKLIDDINRFKREFATKLLPTIKDGVKILREFVNAGSDTAERTLLMRDAADALIYSVRTLAAGFQYLRIGLSQVVVDMARLSAQISALLKRRDLEEYFSLMAEGLQRKQLQLAENAEKLLDYKKALSEVFALGGKQLPDLEMDLTNNFTTDAIRAQKELENLEKSAIAAADKIRDKFQDPFATFQEAIKQIQNAKLFGDLDEFTVTRAINAEVEKLIENIQSGAGRNQERAARTQGAIIAGSQEEHCRKIRASLQAPSSAAKQLRDDVIARAKKIVNDAKFAARMERRTLTTRANATPESRENDLDASVANFDAQLGFASQQAQLFGKQLQEIQFRFDMGFISKLQKVAEQAEVQLKQARLFQQEHRFEQDLGFAPSNQEVFDRKQMKELASQASEFERRIAEADFQFDLGLVNEAERATMIMRAEADAIAERFNRTKFLKDLGFDTPSGADATVRGKDVKDPNTSTAQGERLQKEMDQLRAEVSRTSRTQNVILDRIAAATEKTARIEPITVRTIGA